MTSRGQEIMKDEDLHKVFVAEMDEILRTAKDYKEQMFKMGICRRKWFFGTEIEEGK